MISIGSLCTGYGGLDMAVHAVFGGDLAWVSDIEKNVCTLIDARFPGIPNIGDVKEVDWDLIAPVDVLTAGYPCQPFSHAGKRKGSDDPRHLWPHIAEACRRLLPPVVVLENVRGHVTLGLDQVTATLSDLGYRVEWTVVRASEVGACHQRARVFIVAWRPHADSTLGRLTGSAGEAVPEPGAVERPGRLGGVHAAPDPGGERHGRGQDGRGVGRLDGEDEGGSRERERARQELGDRGAEVAANTDREGLEGCEPARRSDVPAWGDYGDAIRRHEHALGRPAPCPTNERGRLDPRFVEWMMMLPEGWVTDIITNRSAALKMLGNGVVPLQAEHAIRLLVYRASVEEAA